MYIKDFITVNPFLVISTCVNNGTLAFFEKLTNKPSLGVVLSKLTVEYRFHLVVTGRSEPRPSGSGN